MMERAIEMRMIQSVTLRTVRPKGFIARPQWGHELAFLEITCLQSGQSVIPNGGGVSTLPLRIKTIVDASGSVGVGSTVHWIA